MRQDGTLGCTETLCVVCVNIYRSQDFIIDQLVGNGEDILNSLDE